MHPDQGDDLASVLTRYAESQPDPIFTALAEPLPVLVDHDPEVTRTRGPSYAALIAATKEG
jgi:hypothetical protein